MGEDNLHEPGLPSRIFWFFGRYVIRALCAMKGHRRGESVFCRRCGVPIMHGDKVG